MSPSLRQRFFLKSKDSPTQSLQHSQGTTGSTDTTLIPESDPQTDASAPTALSSDPSVSDRDHDTSLNTTLANIHRVPFYRRRNNKSDAALSSSIIKPPTRRRRAKPSFLSRVVHRVVPCVPDSSAPQPDSDTPPSDPLAAQLDSHLNPSLSSDVANQPDNSAALDLPHVMTQESSSPQDPDVIVPPPSSVYLLPQDETDGVTSGAVQPPGSTGEPIARTPTRDTDDSEATSYMDDDGDDTQIDMQAEEDRLIKNGGCGIPIGPDGMPQPLLPPIAPHHAGRKCLVLDLDETLVHSSFRQAVQNADFIVPVEIEYTWHQFHVLKRPGVDAFLKKMGELYEVVVFTASLSKYADPVLDKLDIHQAVAHRLFRESCYSHNGNYVKDLSQLGRAITDTIILDNSPASYIFHPNNAVPVSSWFNDPHDAELVDLIPFLIDLTSVPDVRGILNPARSQ
ncbi:uncharacterized protein ARMOST_00658 [Armillaria ostoyae]|uniref:FCP1 homology domain-containing protein n=1 Tax=Armillaria ostoyae TaxID=47428 RepID=A0A284QLS4_ARMOS|nr:uncharacterized protein ARMOST_00658 [Armillaria ostoyae]